MTDGPDRSDAELEALDALASSSPPPDALLLAAVQEGLQSVPAGSPSAWYEVPRQRTPGSGKSIVRRPDAR